MNTNYFMFNCKKNIMGLLICLVILNISLPVLAENPFLVNGNYVIDGSTVSPRIEVNFRNPPLEIDDQLPTNLAPVSVWDFSVFTNTSYEDGVWIYANETGRIRTFAITGLDTGPSAWMSGELVWEGSYTRDSEVDPTFTLNESWIGVSAGFAGIGLLKRYGIGVPPHAYMQFIVKVCRGVGGLSSGNFCPVVFHHMSKLEGTGDQLKELVYNYGNDVTDGSNPFGGIEPVYTTIGGGPPGNSTLPGYAFVIPKTKRSIDLASVGVGFNEPYTVVYIMAVGVAEDSVDLHYAEAILGDPLDVDAGGFSFQTLHAPTKSNALFCDQVPDLTRFTNHLNGTVTDTVTGLMWQRCPVGYTLDDNATPTELSDDLCEAGLTDTTSDWQAALLNASSDEFATYTDWQLPNVKQLDSLVELSCLASTIDALSFPDTPQNGFWSSTPATDGEKAWQVSFASGDVNPTGKIEAKSVRLVRNSGTQPAAPRPGLVLGDAYINEGDSGSSEMNFLISLTRPLNVDITVEYETLGFTATEGDDYQAASGTLSIPAGQSSALITVTVYGDIAIESNETLQLALSNLSAEVYFANSSALGFIVDDEARISVEPVSAEQAEGDIGTQIYEFIISLDKPATSTVTVDYATEDGGALAGEDYVAITGTAIINIGDTSTSVFVTVNGDTQRENDESFTLTLSNAMGGTLYDASPITAIISDDDGSAAGYQALNDTGVTQCATSDRLGNCPEIDFPEQDGDVGLDANNNDDSDGIAGFSFTKLDSAGLPISNQAAVYYFDHYTFSMNSSYAIWDCAKDQITGLTWEVKTDVPDELRNSEWLFSWYNSTGVNDGGGAGVANGGACTNNSSCDTEKYVAAVNASNLCGFSDWRLPRVDELHTLAVYGSKGFVVDGLDRAYFPHHVSGPVWTATPVAQDTDGAWAIKFQAYDSDITVTDKSSINRVRLVRDGL